MWCVSQNNTMLECAVVSRPVFVMELVTLPRVTIAQVMSPEVSKAVSLEVGQGVRHEAGKLVLRLLDYSQAYS